MAEKLAPSDPDMYLCHSLLDQRLGMVDTVCCKSWREPRQRILAAVECGSNALSYREKSEKGTRCCFQVVVVSPCKWDTGKGSDVKVFDHSFISFPPVKRWEPRPWRGRANVEPVITLAPLILEDTEGYKSTEHGSGHFW